MGNVVYRQRKTPTPTMLSPGNTAAASSRSGEHQHPGYWIEPHTHHTYPLAFEAYRKQREAEERPRPRHRGLGPDVDGYVWRRWGNTRSPDVEIHLTLRADTSHRIRRLVAEILRSIQRGRSAKDAIQRASRRFGLRKTQTRACLAASVGFTPSPRGDAISRSAERPWFA